MTRIVARALLALLLIAAPSSAAPERQQHKQPVADGRGHKAHTLPTERATPTPPATQTTAATATKHEPSATETQRATGEKDGGWPPITDPFWSNWALFVAALIASYIALRTLGAIER